MKVAIIAPLGNLELMDLGDYYFALPHLKNDEYVDKLKNGDKYVMLDNGAFEDVCPSIDELIEFAYEIEADEIVAPDILRDPASFSLSYEFLTEYDLQENFRLQVVPQGNGPKRWLDAYKKWTQHRDLFDVIGVPIWLYSDFNARIDMFKNILNSRFYLDDIDYHFLGLDRVSELASCASYIHSVDTSLPVTYAYHHKELDIYEENKLPRVDLFGSVEDVTLAEQNCRALQEFSLRVVGQ